MHAYLFKSYHTESLAALKSILINVNILK